MISSGPQLVLFGRVHAYRFGQVGSEVGGARFVVAFYAINVACVGKVKKHAIMSKNFTSV